MGLPAWMWVDRAPLRGEAAGQQACWAMSAAGVSRAHPVPRPGRLVKGRAGTRDRPTLDEPWAQMPPATMGMSQPLCGWLGCAPGLDRAPAWRTNTRSSTSTHTYAERPSFCLMAFSVEAISLQPAVLMPEWGRIPAPRLRLPRWQQVDCFRSQTGRRQPVPSGLRTAEGVRPRTPPLAA